MPGQYGLTERKQQIFQSTAGVDHVVALEASAADLDTFNVGRLPIEVDEFFLEFTGDTYQTGGNDLVISLDYRPTYGSDTDRVQLTTITVPHVHVTLTGPQASDIFRIRFEPKVCAPGSQLVSEVKTAYGGSGPVGDFIAGFLWDYHTEVVENYDNITTVTE